MNKSESANSLTSLQEHVNECFVCLEDGIKNGCEPLVSSIHLRTCGCRFFVHPSCWNAWVTGKTDYDCPICRRASMMKIGIFPNPVMYVPQEVIFHRERNKALIIVCMVIAGCIFVSASICLIILYGN